MKFGPMIAVTDTNIYRYSAKPERHPSLCKQQIIKILTFLWLSKFSNKYFHLSCSSLFFMFVMSHYTPRYS